MPFGADHVAALLAVAALSVGLCTWLRRGASATVERLLRVGLASAVFLFAAHEVRRAVAEGWFEWTMVVPLHICDAAIWLSIAGLITANRRITEVLYFWAATGGVLAMLTPDILRGFPDLEFLVFFGLHGLVVVSACVLVFGLGVVPPPGAPWRVAAVTVGFAAVAGLVNVVFDTNYMYLAHKPANATLLDRFGPWPWYIVMAGALAVALFHLADWPLRRLVPKRGVAGR